MILFRSGHQSHSPVVPRASGGDLTWSVVLQPPTRRYLADLGGPEQTLFHRTHHLFHRTRTRQLKHPMEHDLAPEVQDFSHVIFSIDIQLFHLDGQQTPVLVDPDLNLSASVARNSRDVRRA